MSKSWALAAPEASTAAAMVTYVGGEESGGSGVAWVRWVYGKWEEAKRVG
jgi:hypothetical protein